MYLTLIKCKFCAGTTWVQEIVFRIVTVSSHSVPSHSLDENMEDRFPYLEYIYPGLKEIGKRPSPRFIKSHLPYHLLPSDAVSGTGKVTTE